MVDPRLTLYGAEAEDPYLVGNLGTNGELEPFSQQQSYEASSTVNATSDIWTPDNSMLPALRSVVPKFIADEGFPSLSFSFTNTLGLTSRLYRQILFSVANNFAGLENFSATELSRVLKKGTYWNLYQIARSTQTYSSRAIIQRLFEVAIEAGDANIVDVLIRENPRDIKINEHFCSAGYEKLTPIERAAYLRHEAVVKCLVEHNADVNITDPESFQEHCHGALFHALGYLEYDHKRNQSRFQPHLNIFKCLLGAGGDLTGEQMLSFIDHGDVKLVLLLMSVNTRKSAAEWSRSGVFCRAVEIADEYTALEIVKVMLEHGADINYDVTSHSDFGFRSRTVINTAAHRGFLRVVKLLLDSGASTNSDTLPIALISGDQDLASLLLARGADVNSCGSLEITPVGAAIRCEVTQVLKLIEDHGISAKMQAQVYLAGMFRAASASANIPMITQLIRHGCKVSLKDLDYALRAATKEGRTRAAKILIDAGANVNSYFAFATGFGRAYIEPEYINILFRDHFEPLLIEALRARSETLVMAVLDADADLEPRCGQAAPIVLAAEWGNLFVIKSLIFAGANINKISDGPDRNGDTALNIAVKRQDYELARFFLAFGADINNPGLRPREWSDSRFDETDDWMLEDTKSTALAAAVRKEDLEMACFLLDQGADPNDSVALSWATLKDKKFVDLLFEKYSAKYPMGTKYFGVTSLARAIEDENERIVKLLLERKVNANEIMHVDSPFGLVISKHPEIFPGCLELFLQNGCHPNDVVSETSVSVGQESIRLRTTGFLAAIDTRNTSTVELFIRYGADVKFPTRGPVKRTPIQRAAEVGSLDILELLFNHGADINAPPAERGGGTALQFAAIRGYIPMACWLLSHGADPNGASSKVNGRTALEGAAEHGRLDMVQLLLNAGAGSRPGDDRQVANAIELARSNGHYPICDLLDNYFSSRRHGSALEILSNDTIGSIPDLNLDEDFSDLVNFDF